MRPLRAALAAAALALGCDTVAVNVPTPSPGGKADTLGLDPCTEEHNDWLLFEYAPLVCEEGPDCVGKVPLSTRPDCDGAPSWSQVWEYTWFRHVGGFWALRRNQARADFMLSESPHFLDHDRFVEMTAPTEEENAAYQALVALAPRPDEYSYDSWLQLYNVTVVEFASPLYSQALLPGAEVLSGRDVCGGPFVFDETGEGFWCDHEPALFFNPSEDALLTMLEGIRPEPFAEDFDFATWSDIYEGYLRDDELLTSVDFVFPRHTGEGLSGYELAFFERLRSVRPTGTVGSYDSDRWIMLDTLMLLGVDFDLSDTVLQLDLFEKSRPDQLVGTSAYKTWLGVPLGNGFDGLSNDPRKLPRLLDSKPCARNLVELAEQQQIFNQFEPHSATADLALAEPATCN